MNKESYEQLTAVYSDTDNHRPSIIAWTDGNRFSNLIMHEYGSGFGHGSYRIRYPVPQTQYRFGAVTEAEGLMKILPDGIALTDATVRYDDGSEKTGGIFYISITEGTSVTDLHSEETLVVSFPPEIQPQPRQ